MILLEPTSNQDLPYLYEMLRKQEIAEMLFWDYSKFSLQTLAATLLAATGGTESRAFSIINGEALVGVVTVNDIHPIHRSATVGMLAVHPDTPKRGWCGYYAGQELVKRGFDALNLNRLDCRVMAHNKPIQTLIKRIGFTLEGVVRDAIYKNGEFVDIKLFSLLREDWNATRRA